VVVRPVTRTSHGLVSLALLLGGLVVGLVAAFLRSFAAGAVLAATTAVALVTVVYAYCGKCACRDHACGHVVPGRVAALLPSRRSGDYTRGDHLAVVVSFAALIGLPQLWLWRIPALGISFWVLLMSAVAEIRRFVCPGCENDLCAVHPGADDRDDTDRAQPPLSGCG
jgi:hypothetical protein